MLTITDSDFQRLISFVKANYGIYLSNKKQIIIGRLSGTIMSMGFNSFKDYVDYLLKNKKPEDLELMLNKLTTNYTYFMREEAHFKFFTDTILPYLERRLLFRGGALYHFYVVEGVFRFEAWLGYESAGYGYFQECSWCGPACGVR